MSGSAVLGCGNGPTQADAELNLLAEAEAAGADYIVKLGTATAVMNMEAGPYEAHKQVEAALAQSAVSYTLLRPNLFMQMAGAGPIGIGAALRESDECQHPFASAKISMIDCVDVGLAAAELLCAASIDAHAGRVVELTGPEAVGYADIASEASHLRPRPVQVQPVAVDDYVPVPPLRAFLSVLASGCSEVSRNFEAITGRTPRGIAEFVRDNPAPFLPGKFLRLVGDQAASFGEGARVVELDTPAELGALAADEVLVRVLCAGVNGGADTFDLTRAAEGATGVPLGHEGVGRVVAAGRNVTTCRPGDDVVFIGGGYSQYTRVMGRLCSPVDLAAAPAAEHVALRISGLTAAVALGHTAPVSPSDVVVVTACCGATGSFAVQIAKRAGATVVGTVGRAAKVDVARRLGVDRCVVVRGEGAEDLGCVLRDEFPQGVDVAYEGVGGALLGAIVDNLKSTGKILVVGSISAYPHNAQPEPHGVAELPDDLMAGVFRPGEHCGSRIVHTHLPACEPNPKLLTMTLLGGLLRRQDGRAGGWRQLDWQRVGRLVHLWHTPRRP